MRSGELATDNGCKVNGEAIYIRCCKPDDDHSHHTMIGKVSQVGYDYNDEYPTYQLNDYCQTTSLDGFVDDDEHTHTHEGEEAEGHMHTDHEHPWTMVGCTGWMGTEEAFESSEGTAQNTMASNIIGTKVVMHANANETNCKAHRSDKGFVAASAIAVSIDCTYGFECITVESGGSRMPSKIDAKSDVDIWGSMDFCPDGFNLMDCTGYSAESMKNCNRRDESGDRVNAVVFHGADLGCMADRNAHCSTTGFTNATRVQATCCRIRDHHMDEPAHSNHTHHQ